MKTLFWDELTNNIFLSELLNNSPVEFDVSLDCNKIKSKQIILIHTLYEDSINKCNTKGIWKVFYTTGGKDKLYDLNKTKEKEVALISKDTLKRQLYKFLKLIENKKEIELEDIYTLIEYKSDWEEMFDKVYDDFYKGKNIDKSVNDLNQSINNTESTYTK